MKRILWLTAILATLAVPAMATSGYTPAAGEAGFTTHAMPASGKTREQVQRELLAWRANPVTSDGWRQVGGEVGWVFVGVPSRASRSDVLADLARWQRNPVGADGWMEIGGEGGGFYVGRSDGRR